ncbi:TonB family protein [Pseudomonas sp. NPDC087358]|uniref:TonB family protein n=1 Tax=Pseudomonas sp. NPDC087358 TaxID=3364439 RepID=UPI00384C5442
MFVRIYAFIFLLLLSLHGWASEYRLAPIFTPAPEYPPALVEARYTGKVRVHLTIGPSGSVQSANVRESSHPDLLIAVQRAVVQWRFRPWDDQPDGPAKIEFPLLILFGAQGIEPFSSELSLGLNNALCAYLNYEVRMSKRDFPKAPLSKVDLFWYTAEFLESDYAALRVPDENQRKALLTLLERSVPQVVSSCKSKPDSRYAAHLPSEIGGLLVDVKRNRTSINSYSWSPTWWAGAAWQQVRLIETTEGIRE